LLKLIPKIIY